MRLAQVLTWIGATIIATAGTVTFVYANFQTKDASVKDASFSSYRSDEIIQRLDRIEKKSDDRFDRIEKKVDRLSDYN